MNQNRDTTLRPINLSESAAVAELATELGYPATTEAIASRLKRVLPHPEHCLFGAYDPHRLLAWMHLVIQYPIEAEPYAEVCGLVVSHRHRGQGIGRQLLETAKQWTQEKSLCKLRVRCQTRRRDAQRFYRENGFIADKTQTVFSLSL
ncbi:GNAT family N-acetyltransferase [Sedimenticola sp.]|uniref:GNAT family N-acetyltransferase n=1 Tax=Sedimenticola sp. TaxID=1940285 RepID=UPI003D0AA9DE